MSPFGIVSMRTKATAQIVTLLLLLAIHGAIACAEAGEVRVLRFGGSGSNLGAIRLLAEAFTAERAGVEIEVLASIGSGGGIRAVADGVLDLGLASRGLNESEQYKEVQLVPYATSSFGFFTNNDTVGQELSLADIRDAFAGKRVFWEDGLIVRPVLRPRNDSDTQTLLKAFPGLKDALERAFLRRGVPVTGLDQANMDLLETLPGALGTATMGAVRAEGRRLKPVRVVGSGTDQKGEGDVLYPMHKTLYFVLGRHTDNVVREFLGFVGSERGKSLLESTGHQPIALDAVLIQ